MDETVERIQKMISSLSYTELGELIELIQGERVGKLDEARRRLMSEFEEKAALIGLTPKQAFPTPRTDGRIGAVLVCGG